MNSPDYANNIGREKIVEHLSEDDRYKDKVWFKLLYQDLMLERELSGTTCKMFLLNSYKLRTA